jgi:ubiquinone/menaquinone biosynthesis C-methylase UbiE
MPIDKEKTIRSYDIVAPFYDFFRKRTHRWDREIMPFVLETLKPQSGEWILDAGTGPGIYAIQIAKLCPESKVTGVDLSVKFLEIARKNAEESGVANVEFKRGDLEELPFANHSFDKLVCAGVISAVPNRKTAAKELYRVLKPGGLAIITEPNQGKNIYDKAFLALLYILGLFSPKLKGFEAGDFNKYYFDEPSFHSLFHTVGFSEIKIEHRRGSLCAICRKE